MKIQFKENVEQGIYAVSVLPYERERGEIGIDFDNSSKQLIISEITLFQAIKIKGSIIKLIKGLEKEEIKQRSLENNGATS